VVARYWVALVLVVVLVLALAIYAVAPTAAMVRGPEFNCVLFAADAGATERPAPTAYGVNMSGADKMKRDGWLCRPDAAPLPERGD
jgi:hypothetical protein